MIDALLKSKKYRTISSDYLAFLTNQESMQRKSEKETIKRVKRKLHQTAGIFFPELLDFNDWQQTINKILIDKNSKGMQFYNEDKMTQEIKTICCDFMKSHTSTCERVDSLDTFYTTIFEHISEPIHRIADLGCGLNPLSYLWIPEFTQKEFFFCDIYKEMINFLHILLSELNIKNRGSVCNLLQDHPSEKYDLVFALKLVPTLEQVQKGAGFRLLERIHARYMVVSFPRYSVTGKACGMDEHYEKQMEFWLSTGNWQTKQVIFPNELVFIINTY